MKYLNKLFAFNDQPPEEKSSITLASKLYSVIFSQDPIRSKLIDDVRLSSKDSNQDAKITFFACSQTIESSFGPKFHLKLDKSDKSNFNPVTSLTNKEKLTSYKSPSIDEDDWIFIETNYYEVNENLSNQLEQMALNQTDLDSIKASWIPVRNDPNAGILLFKKLFTKHPQYLSFFSKFPDLNLDLMHEDRRLVGHGNKVLDKVGLVVDSIGDESKTSLLNEELENLVKYHLKKRIGYDEFRNLGVILIDFICEINNRRDGIQSSGSQTNNNLSGNVTSVQSISSSTRRALSTDALVTAWTKLYKSILDLVKREAGEQATVD